MYSLLLALSVCLRLCAARAVSGDVSTAQIASGALFQRAANDLLSERNTASSPNRTSGNLLLPLGPIDRRGYQLDVTPKFHYTFPLMKGGPLIYALSCEAKNIWMLTASHELRAVDRSTFPPFFFIEVELKPTAIAPTSVTYEKMGAAIMYLTNDLLHGYYWPGTIDVSVSEITGVEEPTKRPLGELFVKRKLFQKPEEGMMFPGPSGVGSIKAMAVHSGRNSTGAATSLLGASISDRKWLLCFSKLLWFIFGHEAWRSMRADLDPPKTISSRDVPGMEFSLSITKDIPQNVRWIELAMGMIYILRDWVSGARGDHWEPMESAKILTPDGVIVATISIVPIPSAADG